MMLLQVHALLISHLKSQIPLVGKDRKKAELIKHLDEVLCDEDDEGFPRLEVVVPRELASGFINNKKENYKFR